MTTTYEVLCHRVLLRLPSSDGKTQLAVKEAVNTAQRMIAKEKDFDELITLDRTHAFTSTSSNYYHLVNDLRLVRPKQVYTIRLMDENNSRKLEYVSPSELDEIIPYVDGLGTTHASLYTQRGDYIEVVPQPDAVYALYIMHSQWPLVLEDDDDETSYEDLDDVIVSLANVLTRDILDIQNNRTMYTPDRSDIVKQLLSGSIKDESNRPDQRRVASPFQITPSVPIGEYWNNPFIRRNPK